jgi:hypothetical protein
MGKRRRRCQENQQRWRIRGRKGDGGAKEKGRQAGRQAGRDLVGCLGPGIKETRKREVLPGNVLPHAVVTLVPAHKRQPHKDVSRVVGLWPRPCTESAGVLGGNKEDKGGEERVDVIWIGLGMDG